jgi:hypothetical protein
MAEVRIRKENERDFELLFSLSEETLGFLVDNLEKAEIGLSPKKLSGQLHELLGIAPGDLERIINLVYGVNQVRLSSGFSPDQVANDFVDALGRTGNESLKRDCARNYLLRILSIGGSTTATIKATETAVDRDKILMDTKIITDIRPIFDRDSISGLVVIHTLKIEYRDERGKSNEIYFALDRDDLKNLWENISLAESRENSIKTSIAGSKFVDLA